MGLINYYLERSAERKVERSARKAATEIAIASDQEQLDSPIVLRARRVPRNMSHAEYGQAVGERTCCKLAQIGMADIVTYDEAASADRPQDHPKTPVVFTPATD